MFKVFKFSIVENFTMVQNITKSRFLDLNCGNCEQILDNVKKYISKYDCPEMTLDLSRLNILDAAKVMVLSSAYHYKKYPQGKVKCRVQSDNVKGLVSAFATDNLEVINS